MRMAEFFAGLCSSEYRLSALAELTGDNRIRVQPSQHICVEVIFNWLLADNGVGQDERLGKFLHRVDSFSLKQAEKHKNEPLPFSPLDQDNSFVAYYGNMGKRQAVLSLLELSLKTDEPGELYLFSDENTEWMFEDRPFCRNWASMCAVWRSGATVCTASRSCPKALNIPAAP